jgi:hypothetical protein
VAKKHQGHSQIWHTEANQQQELLLKLAKDKVGRGFTLPLPLIKIKKIPGVLLATLNIQLQKMINERGEINQRNRLTHDQNWKWQSGTSFNSRVNKEKLMPCYSGKALKWLINWAGPDRKLHPKKRILASKFGIKSAFH